MCLPCAMGREKEKPHVVKLKTLHLWNPLVGCTAFDRLNNQLTDFVYG